MNLNDLTFGQIKELCAIFGAKPDQLGCCKNHPYEIGKGYIVRTVTMIYTGKLIEVWPEELVLTECAWIPETDRYSQFVESGSVKECEPYPADRRVVIGRGSIIDAVVLNSALPRSQK